MHALRIALASGFGALVGSLASLEALPYLGLPTWCWVFCALIGGSVGYLVHDPKQVVTASTFAWKEIYDWRPDIPYWQAIGSLQLFMALILAHLALPLMLLALLSGSYYTEVLVVIGLSLGSSIVFGFLIVSTALSFEGSVASKLRDEITCQFKFFLPWKREYWLYEMVRAIPMVLVSVWWFIKGVVVLVHSDARTVCSLGGILGTAVGAYTGSWLIGAVAGAAIGLASYELVGKRLLGTSRNV